VTQPLNEASAAASAGHFYLQYRGFDYVAFYNGAYENADSLPTLVETGANSIEATLDYGIDAQTSQVVADPNYNRQPQRTWIYNRASRKPRPFRHGQAADRFPQPGRVRALQRR
jgi:hypothetical protein